MSGNKARALRNSKYVVAARVDKKRRVYKSLKKMYKMGYELDRLV